MTHPEGKPTLKLEEIIDLMTICLENTGFKFWGEFYEMSDSLAMGSPLSPVLAYLFVEDLESRALSSLEDNKRPQCWHTYVDDVFSVVKQHLLSATIQHLNNQNPAIEFTMESEVNGKLPFLDTIVTKQAYGRLVTNVYRKPTHSDRYLHFSSHHPFNAKLAGIDTFLAEGKAISQTPRITRKRWATLREP